jgi:dephospho-CoA kinase
MTILGITGSIASGKSTVAKMFAYYGVPVFDADKTAHLLMHTHTPTIEHIAALFPEAHHNGTIHRPTLGKMVFGNTPLLKQLEGILHPAIRQCEHVFISHQRRLGHRIILLDIPLLFETGSQSRIDASIVVRAPQFLILQRALARPHMTAEKLNHILQQQMPIHKKMQLADHIIHTGAGKAATMQQVKQLLITYQ